MVFLGLSGLASLLVENNLNAEEYKLKENKETQIIKPTLEEITTLLSKTPQEILEPAIKGGGIKKFEYTMNTTPEDFYKFLNNQKGNNKIFIFLYLDQTTPIKNNWKRFSGRDVSSASATVFYYISINLRKRGIDYAYVFFEIVDFYGRSNWEKLHKMFNVNEIDFPSWAEFVKRKDNYKLNEIGSAGILSEDIIKYIELNVEEYSKK